MFQDAEKTSLLFYLFSQLLTRFTSKINMKICNMNNSINVLFLKQRIKFHIQNIQNIHLLPGDSLCLRESVGLAG